MSTRGSVVIWQADGTLAIREVLISAGLRIDSVYTYDPAAEGGSLSLIIQYTDMSRYTLSDAFTTCPQGDKSDVGESIAQILSLTVDSLMLSGDGGKVGMSNTNELQDLSGIRNSLTYNRDSVVAV